MTPAGDLPGHLAAALVVSVWLRLFSYLATRSEWGLAFIGLLGTWLHEMTHLLVGALLGARPVSFSVFPVRQDGGWVLGSVGFSRLNWANGVFVALAPLSLVPLAFWVEMGVMRTAYWEGNWLSFLGWGFVAANALAACMPSRQDLTIGATSFLIWGLLAYAGWGLISG
jgi:hypothetical protein